MTTRKLSDLKPNPGNPRTVTAQKKRMLAASLKRFGDLGGVVFNIWSGQLVGGHQRVDVFSDATFDIMKTNAKPDAQGTVCEGYIETKDGRHSYREVAWDADTEKAANLAANKGAGDFDMPQVSAWLGALDKEGFDLDLTMFDEDERSAMFPVQEQNEKEENTDEVELDGAPEERCAVGDMWALGRHRLMCADSSVPQNLDALLRGSEINMVMTDPPYGINLNTDYSRHDKYDTEKTKAFAGSRLKRNKHQPIFGDDEDYDPGFLLAYFDGVKEIFLWGADYYCQQLPKDGSWTLWDKRQADDGTLHEGFHGSFFELCWSKAKHQKRICRHLWSGILQKTSEKYVHPSQKPVAVIKWFFDQWGSEGDNVVDLYGGSGSTLLACEHTGRSCFIMEMSPAYCDIVLARWEAMTGLQATRMDNSSNRIAIDA